MDRELTDKEASLIAWLLEHGNDKARSHISSISDARVVSECACGCATIDLSIGGALPLESAGLEVVSDYLWKSSAGAENGIFVFLKENQLAGMEVWSIDGTEVPGLPEIDQLRPYDGST